MTAHTKLGYAAASIAVFFAANTFVSLQANIFTDVSDEATYAPAVTDLQAAGIIEGYDDGTFRPDITINRAEFTKIIAASRYDLESKEADQCMIRNLRGDAILFPDVPADGWFARHVCMAFEYRLVGGYPDGTFRPATDISFIEAAKILVTAYEPTIYPGKPTWYVPYTEKLKEWGAIPPSIIALNQKITRGEMADMMYRVRNAQNTEDTFSPDPSYMTIPTQAEVPPPLPPPAVEEESDSSVEFEEAPTFEEQPIETEGVESSSAESELLTESSASEETVQ